MRKTQSAELPRGAKNLNTCSSSSSSLGVVVIIIRRICQQTRKARQIHPTCRRRRRRVTSSTSSERQEHMSRRVLSQQKVREPQKVSCPRMGFRRRELHPQMLLLVNVVRWLDCQRCLLLCPSIVMLPLLPKNLGCPPYLGQNTFAFRDCSHQAQSYCLFRPLLLVFQPLESPFVIF